jgi:hypothetical protein
MPSRRSSAPAAAAAASPLGEEPLELIHWISFVPHGISTVSA